MNIFDVRLRVADTCKNPSATEAAEGQGMTRLGACYFLAGATSAATLIFLKAFSRAASPVLVAS